jgi:hypothetical protein
VQITDDGEYGTSKIEAGSGLDLDYACRLELAILVREIRFNVSLEPAQCSRRDGWNRRVLSAGRAAPKEGHMGAEVPAFHNVSQLLQAIVLIPKGSD